MKAEPQKEHRWLQKFVGQWTFEVQATMEQDTPPPKFRGTESVRSLGGLWILAEGQGEICGGGMATTVTMLGYDPRKELYVGTWIGSMMPHLWLYNGTLDADGRVLTLDTEGPCLEAAAGKMARYREVTEFKTDDHRVLTSHMLDDDGKWLSFMTANYRRKK